MNQRVMVVVPTYNEADNIEELVKKLREKGVELIIVDDFSPDGTWKIVDNLGKEDTGVHLIVRKGKKSFGFAIREGLIKALDMGADVIVEMDADFSHSIEDQATQ